MKKKFMVTVSIPRGVTIREMQAYIREAVASWHGGCDPETPIFYFSSKSLTVRPVRQADETSDNIQHNDSRYSLPYSGGGGSDVS